MASSANINIKFSVKLDEFVSQMQKVSRKLKVVGKKLEKVGKTMSVGVTAPFLAFSALSLKNWDTQAKAIAQVEAGLISTGNAVGYTSTQLQKMASDLQNNTLFGDEEILKGVTSQLLTFTNITGVQFQRTQQAALDLATRLDGDLKGASIQLGKALNDPVKGLSALSKSGIQFSEAQKKTIRTLVETNKLAEAQTLILNELEKQYGGSAAAAAKAGTGALKQLSNSIGDLSEEFGKIISEAILPFVDVLKEWVRGFSNLSPVTKKFIVLLSGVAAVIGPLLALAGTVLPAISAGFTLLMGPIGLVLAALTSVGVVVYKNWAPIKKVLVNIANYFVDLYNESTVFRVGVEGVVLAFKNMWSIAKFVFSSLKEVFLSFVDSFVSKFKLFGSIFKLVLTGEFSKIPELIKGFGKELQNGFSSTTLGLRKNWSGLLLNISDDTEKAINKIQKRAKIKFLKENTDISGVLKKVESVSPLNIPVVLGGKKKRKQVFDVLNGKRGVNGEVSQEISGFGTGSSVKPDFSSGIDETVNGLRKKLTAFQEAAAEITSSISGAFETMGNNMIASFDLADNGFQGFVKNLGKTVTKLISMLLANSIANSITGATQSGMSTGPAAIFTTPAFIATAVSGVVAAFAAIPKFETGGVVGGSSFYGDKILARVNSGELILNTQQQRSLFGMISSPNTAPVNVVLKGKLTTDAGKLNVLLEKDKAKKNRRG
ncbi:phage tail length tape measure family protein [Tenacibaculum sp. 190524A02b]|uniref:phage tail length tape measure family protein n=1 Tax=Tenacibaculum vairaonense TaxID=3137860 RepID=UPI0031FB6865